MAWYKGSTLLDAINHLEAAKGSRSLRPRVMHLPRILALIQDFLISAQPGTFTADHFETYCLKPAVNSTGGLSGRLHSGNRVQSERTSMTACLFNWVFVQCDCRGFG